MFQESKTEAPPRVSFDSGISDGGSKRMGKRDSCVLLKRRWFENSPGLRPPRGHVELRPSAVNTLAVAGHVFVEPVARSSRRSATEIPPARHRSGHGKSRISRSSRRRNASRGATSPTRAISETSPTFRMILCLQRIHCTGLALCQAGRGSGLIAERCWRDWPQSAYSAYTNSLLLNTTRQSAAKPCFSANSTSGARSVSIKSRP